MPLVIALPVQLTKDGALAVFHDKTLQRVCGENRRLEECTAEDLAALRLFETDAPSPHAHYLCWKTGIMDRWECSAFAEWLHKSMS